jgi:aryl-alcohol dehydrogenase-like predicted oxidoreductase
MKLRRLGNSQLLASEIALGTVELGLDYGIPGDGGNLRPPESEAIRVLNEALDLGVNFIDTARAYGNSEELIGKALHHRRGEYLLATKLCPLQAGDLNAPDLRARIRASVETSMRMLQTDWIDLLMIHSAPIEVIEGADLILEALQDLKNAGHVRYVGASVYGEAGAAALRRGGFDCLQIAYNALDRVAESDLLPAAASQGVGIVARSVLLKGALTARYRDLPESLGALKDAVRSLEALAQAAGMSLPEIAFRYVVASGVIALCGTARSAELISAVDYANRGPLPPDLSSEIAKIEIADRKWLHPGNWDSLLASTKGQ